MFQKTLTRGRYNESNYPVQELGRKEEGGRIFEGGVLAGHYGTLLDETEQAWHVDIVWGFLTMHGARMFSLHLQPDLCCSKACCFLL